MDLARQAGQSGADIMMNTSVIDVIKKHEYVEGVRARNEGREFNIYTKVVIGADGFESGIARWAGLGRPTTASPQIIYEVVNIKDVVPEILEYYLSKDFAPGSYAGITPKGHNVANAGLGFRSEYMDKRISLKELYSLFCKHPVAGAKLLEAKTVAMRAGTLWMGGPIRKLVANGLIIAGDAAGHANAIGGGIDSSMICGHLAGDVAAKAVINGDVSENQLRDYERKSNELVGDRLRRHAEVSRELTDPILRSNELIERAMSDIGREFVGVYAGELQYVDPLREWIKDTARN